MLDDHPLLNKIPLRLLAKLDLAKIALSIGDRAGAEKRLLELSGGKSQEVDQSPLYPEILFLQGRVELMKKNQALAESFFEEAYSLTRCPEIATHLAHAYLQGLGQIEEKKERALLFDKVEKLLEGPSEEQAITKAILLLLKARDCPECAQELEGFIKKIEGDLGEENRHRLLLLLAESKPSTEEGLKEKERLFLQATQERYQKLDSYKLAWHLFGLFYIEMALEADGSAHHYLQKAYFSLERALACKSTSSFDALQELLLMGRFDLSFAKRALAQSSELNLTDEEKEELAYLDALILSHQGVQMNDERLLHEAIDLLAKRPCADPGSEKAARSLNLIARLHSSLGQNEEAKASFLKLVELSPKSELAPEALFWAASCEKESEKRERLLVRCYENYPESAIAKSAFLQLFAFDSYLEGDQEALLHLMGFFSIFPKRSPEAIVVHTLLGLHACEVEKASEHFGHAIDIFEGAERELLELPELYFYMRASYEMAKIERDLPRLLKLESELNSQKELFLQESFFTLFEECELVLARLFLDCGESNKAEARTAILFEEFMRRGTTSGYGLTQVWILEGRLALNRGEIQAALDSFQNAGSLGDSFLSQEEKLELWLLQSEGYLRQNRSDLAMRMLSKVINEDAASNLRLKAMYLRAAIYEQERKYQLAFRQLEALSKKGGEWGQKAKDKLRATYGLE